MHIYHQIPLEELSLECYRDKDALLDFMSFLQYRGCGVPHMVKHLSPRKRALWYLSTCEGMSPQTRRQRDLDREWHDNMVREIKGQAPPVLPPPPLPTTQAVFSFICGIIEEAKSAVAKEAEEGGECSYDTAWSVQRAICGALSTGTHSVCARLSYLKSARHPDSLATGPCPDRECLNPDVCRGNRFEVICPGEEVETHLEDWEEDEAAIKDMRGGSEDEMEDVDRDNEDMDRPVVDLGSAALRNNRATSRTVASSPIGVASSRVKRIVFFNEHHKTSRVGIKRLKYTIPSGDLTDLLLYHMEQGSHKLTNNGDHLFATASGKPFDDQSFYSYFKDHVLEGAPFPPFAPSKGRNIFVAGYTGPGGAPTSKHFGAAAVSIV